MIVRCAHDELLPIPVLKPHPKNANVHSDEQIYRLAQVLDYQGWRAPIKISRLSGFITAGHGRLLAAKLLKYDKVPVNYQEYESEAQEYADLIADNSLAQWSELDLSLINEQIGDLGPEFDLELLGIDDFEVDVNDKSIDDKKEKKEHMKCPECGQKLKN